MIGDFMCSGFACLVRLLHNIVVVSLILGLLMNYVGVSPIKALIWSAILYGLTAPVLIAVILHIANNKKVMGDFVNGTWSNIFGFLTLILMTAAAVTMVYLQLT
jgi:Mn2+/Fe2+ NRAMP family transporter